MNVPTDRKYSESHEWFTEGDGVVTLGITQFAADELTDVTYIELPTVGKKVTAGDAIGEVESVKATAEVTTAVGGEIIEVNATLADQPELVNDDAFVKGWMVKIHPDSSEPLTKLMDAGQYVAFVERAG